MDGVLISYCNLNGYLIKNQRKRYDIINGLNKRLGYDINNIKTKIYSERIMKNLNNKKTLVTYISSGKQVYLYLTKIYNECLSLIIETNLKDIPKIIAIPLQFNENLYTNTLFMGEIFKTKKNNWMLILENIIMHKNFIIKNNLYKNIELLNTVIKNDFIYNDITPFEVKIKKFFTIIDTKKELLNIGDTIIYKGIKIFGLEYPIIFYFDSKNIKNSVISPKKVLPNIVKFDEEDILKLYSSDIDNINTEIITNTIDNIVWILLIKKTNTYGIYKVYAKNNNDLVEVGKARIETIELSQEIISKTGDFVANCIYCYIFKKFKILSLSNIDLNTKLSDYNEVIKDVNIKNNINSPDYV